MGISVVIPVYNSASILPELVSRLDKVLSATGEEFEVILVNDGSSDNSWNVILDLSKQYTWLTGITLSRNFGQHNAVLCGVRSAKHTITITMDDDLQHPPEEIPKLTATLNEGYEVVYGAPEYEKHSRLRRIATHLTKFALQRLMGAKIARHVTSFRAFRTNLRSAFENFQGPFVSVDVLLTWGASNFGVVRVLHAPRFSGQSTYTLGKLIRHALNLLTGFSTFPLQFASILGFFFTLAGFLLLLYVLAYRFLNEGVVPGFTFLAAAIAMFSGVQLFSLGMIGEYLIRMHYRLMGMPNYVVRESTSRSDATASSLK